MKRLQHLHLPLLCMLLLLGACVSDDLSEDTITNTPQPQEIISTNVYGKVVDADGQAATSATVTLTTHQGPQTVDTDENGNFEFFDVANRGPSAFITVDYPGYFQGYRRMSVLKSTFNYTEIQLLPRTLAGRIESATGGSVRTAEGMAVTLQAGGIVDANGTPYSGTVDVYMAYLDPTDPDLAARMIGDLSGRAADGRNVSLTTYGMVHVELESPSGATLQLADNAPATLDYPVPSDILGRAPGTIPLWYYDADQGTWVEEGEARLEGSRYIGEVAHFSAWNVDFMTDPIEITGCVEINNPQLTASPTGGARLQVFVCSDVIGQKGGWLASDGKFRFYNFPSGEAFTLKIIDECGTELFRMNYGPYTSDTDLGVISVPAPNIGPATLTGSVIDCDGNPVSSGYVIASIDGQNYVVQIQNGSYEFLFTLCGDAPAEVRYQAINTDSLTQSDPTVLTISQGDALSADVTICDVPLATLCRISSPGRFDVIYTLGERLVNDQTFYASYAQPNTGCGDQDSLECFFAFSALDVTGVGTYDLAEQGLFGTFQWDGESVQVSMDSGNPIISTVEFTQYDDAPGGFIRGSIDAQVIMRTTSGEEQIPMTAEFSYLIL